MYNSLMLLTRMSLSKHVLLFSPTSISLSLCYWPLASASFATNSSQLYNWATTNNYCTKKLVDYIYVHSSEQMGSSKLAVYSDILWVHIMHSYQQGQGRGEDNISRDQIADQIHNLQPQWILSWQQSDTI